VKFLKYASRKNWIFSVFTQDTRYPVIPEKELCGFLLEEIPNNIEVIRVSDPLTRKKILHKRFKSLFKDSALPWGVSVAIQGIMTIKKNQPDLIFVNSPPFTNVAVGLFLSLWYHLPLVVDLKDDWVGSSAYYNKGRLRQWLENLLEHFVFSRASAIITATESSCAKVIQRYPQRAIKSKVHYIPNGEDLEEFEGLRNQREKQSEENFLIVSAAAGYRPDYRDLSPFLDTLNDFFNRCPYSKDLTTLEFLGENPDESYINSIQKLLPDTQVFYRGSLGRSDFVRALSRADLFILVQPKKNFTAVSGTLYEYWASGNAPVLLFSERGASSELVIKNKLGMHFLFDQIEDASSYVEQIYKLKQVGMPIILDQSGLQRFDRKENAAKMMQIWNQVLSHKRRI